MKIPVRAGGVLPFSYYEGLVLALRDSKITSFCTHNDIEVNELPDNAGRDDLIAVYREEYDRWWQERIKSSAPAMQVYMLHDCDSGPDQTVHMCLFEDNVGIKSTTSLFNRVLRKGELKVYPIDHEILVPLQKSGHCFTYHCNAAETVSYDFKKIPARFEDDVKQLRARGYFTRHFRRMVGCVVKMGQIITLFFIQI